MRTRTLSTFGVVTDRTPTDLASWGWKLLGSDPWLGLWVDPRTGIRWAISQAEAIRRDRLTPRYAFRYRPNA